MDKAAIIVVDVQGDFTTWKKGSLAVPGTDMAFIEKIQEQTELFSNSGYLIFGTQDWHPVDDVSFTIWPPHCIQGTENARVLIDNNLFLAIVKKSKNSGFQETELDQILKRNGIKKLVVYGIATDYCIKETALDAVDAGYKVTVIEGLCKGVAPETSVKALKEMKEKGVVIR